MKLNKKKLVKFIRGVVKEEVDKRVKEEIDKHKTDIISEVVSYMNQESFNSGSGGANDDDIPVDTDDPVLQRVLKKNKKKDKRETSEDVAKEVYNETETRDPDTIREQIMKAQQKAKSPNPQEAGQNIAQETGQVDVQGPLNESGGAGATAGPMAGAQQPMGNNMGGGEMPQEGDGFPSEDEFQADPGQVQQNAPNPAQQPNTNPNARQPSSQGKRAANQQGTKMSQGNRRKGVNPNSRNVPSYLQDAANRDYSELVDRFDNQ